MSGLRSQKLKILIIDDNENITKMFSKFFELKGYECTVSNSGRNGLTLLEDKKFDVLLLDISMPELTGYDVINELERKNLLKMQKVIVLTATAVTNEEIDTLHRKGIRCLKKPASLNELINEITG